MPSQSGFITSLPQLDRGLARSQHASLMTPCAQIAPCTRYRTMSTIGLNGQTGLYSQPTAEVSDCKRFLDHDGTVQATKPAQTPFAAALSQQLQPRRSQPPRFPAQSTALHRQTPVPELEAPALSCVACRAAGQLPAGRGSGGGSHACLRGGGARRLHPARLAVQPPEVSLPGPLSLLPP